MLRLYKIISMNDKNDHPFYSFRLIIAILFVLLGLFVLPAYLGKWLTQPVLWIPLVIFGVPLFPTLNGVILGTNKVESPVQLVGLYLCETYDLIFQLAFIIVILIPIAFMLSSVIAGIMWLVASVALLSWAGVGIGLPLGVRIPDDWFLIVLGWVGLIVLLAIQFGVITIAQNFSDLFFDLCRAIHNNGIAWIQRAFKVRL